MKKRHSQALFCLSFASWAAVSNLFVAGAATTDPLNDGEQYLLFGDFVRAQPLLKSVYQKASGAERARAAIDLTCACQHADIAPVALALAKEALALNLDSSVALTNYACLQFLYGDRNVAKSYFEKALAVDPGDWRARLGLGQCLAFQYSLTVKDRGVNYSARPIQEALAQFARAQDGAVAGLRIEEKWLALGDSYLVVHSYDRALSCYRKALAASFPAGYPYVERDERMIKTRLVRAALLAGDSAAAAAFVSELLSARLADRDTLDLLIEVYLPALVQPELTKSQSAAVSGASGQSAVESTFLALFTRLNEDFPHEGYYFYKLGRAVERCNALLRNEDEKINSQAGRSGVERKSLKELSQSAYRRGVAEGDFEAALALTRLLSLAGAHVEASRVMREALQWTLRSEPAASRVFDRRLAETILLLNIEHSGDLAFALKKALVGVPGVKLRVSRARLLDWHCACKIASTHYVLAMSKSVLFAFLEPSHNGRGTIVYFPGDASNSSPGGGHKDIWQRVAKEVSVSVYEDREINTLAELVEIVLDCRDAKFEPITNYLHFEAPPLQSALKH